MIVWCRGYICRQPAKTDTNVLGLSACGHVTMADCDCCVGTRGYMGGTLLLIHLIAQFNEPLLELQTTSLGEPVQSPAAGFPHLYETCLKHQLYATVFRAHSRHAQTALFASEAQLLTRLLQLLQGTNLVCLHKEQRLCVAGCAGKL